MRLAPACAALIASIGAAPAHEMTPRPQAVQHAPDCTCRAQGRSFTVGETVCLRLPDGSRLARCGMALNVTSWGITDEPCPET